MNSYYLQFESVYTGGDVTSDYIMQVDDDLIKRPLFLYELLIYTDTITVTRTIEFGGMLYFLVLALVPMVTGKFFFQSPEGDS